MLKAYYEKPKPELVILNNKLGLESPMHSKDCVGQVAEKEENTESEVRLGNDQLPIKLQNSQILNDLGTKLSHLPLVQRKELAEVITQYREVFPDVPSKTNLIEHDVDVGDSAPIKQELPRIADCIDQIGNAKFVSMFDMLKGYFAGTFNSASSQNFCVCNTKRFISVQGHAVWNEKCSSNIPKNG